MRNSGMCTVLFSAGIGERAGRQRLRRPAYRRRVLSRGIAEIVAQGKPPAVAHLVVGAAGQRCRIVGFLKAGFEAAIVVIGLLVVCVHRNGIECRIAHRFRALGVLTFDGGKPE